MAAPSQCASASSQPHFFSLLNQETFELETEKKETTLFGGTKWNSEHRQKSNCPANCSLDVTQRPSWVGWVVPSEMREAQIQVESVRILSPLSPIPSKLHVSMPTPVGRLYYGRQVCQSQICYSLSVPGEGSGDGILRNLRFFFSFLISLKSFPLI